jgi:[ribosomal protein S5]-alanine N-acetyltransferase
MLCAMPGRVVTHLPSIETPSLVVRELRAGDVHDFASYMLRADYQRHMGVIHRNIDQLRSFVLRAIARQDQENRVAFHLAGELKSRGAAVADGFVLQAEGGLVEVGWGVHPLYWGQGIGTQLAGVLLAIAFEHLQAERVWCKVMAGNAASLKLAQRAGLKPWRSHPDFPLGNGRFESVEIFALTAEDYFEAAY